MLDPQRTIGSLSSQFAPFANMGQDIGNRLNQMGQQFGQRMDISGFGNNNPLSFLGQLFGGIGNFGNWWNSRKGEQPGQPTTPEAQAPAEAQYSADRLNPYQANILGGSRSPTGLTTFGSMLGRQPTL